MNQNKAYKSLKYSIRQCGEDEIEIRNSFFDGYTRGFIRLLFIGIFCMSLYQNAKYKQPPFFYEISAIKEDFVWTFNKDSEKVTHVDDRYLGIAEKFLCGELAVALEMSREEVKGYLSSQMKGA